jgi:hypothetical protein
MCATVVVFQKTAQSKQSPVGRKFAQSGHPAQDKKKGSVCSISENGRTRSQSYGRELQPG